MKNYWIRKQKKKMRECGNVEFSMIINGENVYFVLDETYDGSFCMIFDGDIVDSYIQSKLASGNSQEGEKFIVISQDKEYKESWTLAHIDWLRSLRYIKKDGSKYNSVVIHYKDMKNISSKYF